MAGVHRGVALVWFMLGTLPIGLVAFLQLRDAFKTDGHPWQRKNIVLCGLFMLFVSDMLGVCSELAVVPGWFGRVTYTGLRPWVFVFMLASVFSSWKATPNYTKTILLCVGVAVLAAVLTR